MRANMMWTASMALNGLIGAGVPQDWSTHFIGHELTALHGIDHARTLAIILPSMLDHFRTDKHQKLLQYAERVWNIQEGDDQQRIDQAIHKTREFFESLNVKTRLSDYGIDNDAVQVIVEQLVQHGMTQLGEHQTVTPDVALAVLKNSL